jgi:peptidoglycan hydrolase-like protein with peptidoglycan-binding domain
VKNAVAVPLVMVFGAAGAFGFQGRVSEPDGALPQRSPASTPVVKEVHPRDQPAAQAEKQRPEAIRKPRPPRVLEIGMKGPDVRAIQKTLASNTYDPGPADGSFGYMTQHAVLAFQKVNGLELDGTVAPREARSMKKAGIPEPHDHGMSSYVDVDITRQVLFEVEDGKVVHTLPVSTANGATYESRSGLAIANTPRGQFQLYSKTSGWRTSYLGSLYSPSYFYGGYAIHGSSSVPPYPASHGCVRIPMHSADEFFARNPVGTEVLLHD